MSSTVFRNKILQQSTRSMIRTIYIVLK